MNHNYTLNKKDKELREIHQQVRKLYELMGSPEKPEKVMKRGKHGTTTFHEAPVSTEGLIKKMMVKYKEDTSVLVQVRELVNQ